MPPQTARPALSCTIGNSSGISYCTKKPSRQDRTAAEQKMSLTRPAAGGESRKRDSILEDEICAKALLQRYEYWYLIYYVEIYRRDYCISGMIPEFYFERRYAF